MLLHHNRVYMCGIYWNQALIHSWSFVRVYKHSIGMTVIIKLWLGMKERGIRIKHFLAKLIRQQCDGFRAHLWMIQWGPRILAQMGRPSGKHGEWERESEFLQSWCISITSSRLFAGISQSILQLCFMKPWFISEIMICLCLSVHAGNTTKSLCPLNPIMLNSNWVDNTT